MQFSDMKVIALDHLAISFSKTFKAVSVHIVTALSFVIV